MKLTEITLPDSVVSIGASAFDGCSKLEDIHLPEGITSIGTCVFSGCTHFAAIAVPDTVTSLGNIGCEVVLSKDNPNVCDW